MVQDPKNPTSYGVAFSPEVFKGISLSNQRKIWLPGKDESHTPYGLMDLILRENPEISVGGDVFIEKHDWNQVASSIDYSTARFRSGVAYARAFLASSHAQTKIRIVDGKREVDPFASRVNTPFVVSHPLEKGKTTFFIREGGVYDGIYNNAGTGGVQPLEEGDIIKTELFRRNAYMELMDEVLFVPAIGKQIGVLFQPNTAGYGTVYKMTMTKLREATEDFNRRRYAYNRMISDKKVVGEERTILLHEVGLRHGGFENELGVDMYFSDLDDIMEATRFVTEGDNSCLGIMAASILVHVEHEYGSQGVDRFFSAFGTKGTEDLLFDGTLKHEREFDEDLEGKARELCTWAEDSLRTA